MPLKIECRVTAETISSHSTQSMTSAASRLPMGATESARPWAGRTACRDNPAYHLPRRHRCGSQPHRARPRAVPGFFSHSTTVSARSSASPAAAAPWATRLAAGRAGLRCTRNTGETSGTLAGNCGRLPSEAASDEDYRANPTYARPVQGGLMSFSSAEEVLSFIAEEKVEFIDVRFCDLPGRCSTSPFRPSRSTRTSSPRAGCSTDRPSAGSSRSTSRTCCCCPTRPPRCSTRSVSTRR